MRIPADIGPFAPLVLTFVETKDWLLGSVGLSRDAMHVHVGLALFLLMLLVFRLTGWKRAGHWRAFALLAGMSLVAEVFDVMALWSIGAPVERWESFRDVANTLAWPLVLASALSIAGRRGRR